MNQNKFQRSEEIFAEAKKYTPGGVRKNRHPSVFVPRNYPVFLERGEGSHIWDIDGNEYIDWGLSYGPITLGHAYPKVDDAAIDEIKKGFNLNLAKQAEVELARKLVEIIPCAEKVIFCKTGSEATSAAIRIARVYTGRDKIVRWGYHGWLDWSYGGEGVPKKITEDILTFEYNDLDSLERILERNKSQVACLIMMPFDLESPKEGFLQGVRKLTNNYKVILIFDEIRSGFRMALGGAQQYYGVIPDMATFAKGIANGYAISAVVGKSEIMEAVKKTFMSGTFFSSSFEMAAALATIKELETTNAIEHMWQIGRQLLKGMEALVKEADIGIEVQVMGNPPMPFLLFGKKEDYGKVLTSAREGIAENHRVQAFRDTFYTETTKRGVFFHPHHHWFTCFSHSAEDVEKTLEAVREGLYVARQTTR